MSATDELRRLLDERGVKYYDMQNRGIWFGISEDGKDHKYEAFEQTDGLIEIDVFDLTPEQAIAATMGNGTHGNNCEYCNGIMPVPYQYADGFSGYIDIVIDDAVLFVQAGNDELAIPINYCPNCGAKVVKHGR